MERTITGLIRLTRYRDYVAQTIITTLMGFLAYKVHLDLQQIPRMLLVLLANLLCVAFAFMINDVEDAPDDAYDKSKAARNPVTAGLLSPSSAYTFSIIVAISSAVTFYFLGPVTFWLGITSLVLAGLYSWRLLRLKSIPVIDLISHGLMLAGLQLLCAYFAINPYAGFDANWIAPFLFVVCISIRGQLFNQIRDFECDQKAGLKHTTSLVGIRTANILMSALLIIAGIMLIYSLIIQIIPIWLVLIVIPLGVVLLKKPASKYKASQGLEKTYNFQKPVLIIGLISLTLWTLSRFI